MSRFSFRLLISLCSFYLIVGVQIDAAEKQVPPEKLTSAPPGKTICLNMIVKNETHVIKRCLSSVKPFISYWVIVDTGSTDGTQDMIKDFMEGIPGELHERPWVNFRENREEALKLAKGKADYIYFMDADDWIKLEPDFKWPELTKDYYTVRTVAGGWEYDNVRLIKSNLDWHWKDVLHEYVQANNAVTYASLEGMYNIFTHEGARSKDPQKYIKDAQVLEEALKKDPDNVRYVFYLAQSYYSAGNLPKALEVYEKRISMGGWDQEVFWSLLQVAKTKEALDYDPKVVEASYGKAFRYRSTRIEPLYYLVANWRKNENYQRGYDISHVAINMAMPNDNLFVEKWIYDYGMLFEYSICAYWTGHFDESLKACDALLSNPKLPISYRDYTLKNRAYAWEKVRQQNIQKTLSDLLPDDGSIESESKVKTLEAAANGTTK